MGTAEGTLTAGVPCRIVCVGGDGMFSEVLHGLIGRTQRDAGVDQNQPRAALVPSPLRIGIIPAGRGSASPLPPPLPGEHQAGFPSRSFCSRKGDLTATRHSGAEFVEKQFRTEYRTLFCV